jgi:hypothetical protein
VRATCVRVPDLPQCGGDMRAGAMFVQMRCAGGYVLCAGVKWVQYECSGGTRALSVRVKRAYVVCAGRGGLCVQV